MGVTLRIFGKNEAETKMLADFCEKNYTDINSFYYVTITDRHNYSHYSMTDIYWNHPVVVVKSLEILGNKDFDILLELERMRERACLVIYDYKSTWDISDFKKCDAIISLFCDIYHHKVDSHKLSAKVGRKKIDYPTMWEYWYTQWKEGIIDSSVFMYNVNLKKSTFYNLVKEYEKNILNGGNDTNDEILHEYKK